MLKNKSLYTLLLLFLILFNSCRKDENDLKEDPEDMVLNILVDINLRPEAKYFLLLENSQTASIYFEIPNYFGYGILRGDKVKGNAINLHFILLNEKEDNTMVIKSFYDVPLGLQIKINDDNLKNTKSTNSDVELSFENIPDFDIVSRTSINQKQNFTQTMFETEATQSDQMVEKYETGQYFYACFQKDNTASYLLKRTPNSSTYSIDFANLSTQVSKHSFSKTINEATISHADVQAYSNAHLRYDYVELFNLDNFSIYPTSSFDIFVPSNQASISYYVQNFTFESTDHIYNNWYYYGQFQDNISLLDAGLKTTSRIGELPNIQSTEGLWDISEISFEKANFKWTMYSPNTSDFYIPDTPSELASQLPESKTLRQLFLTQDSGTVKLIDYDPFNGYEDILSVYLNETKLELGTSYRTQEQLFSTK